MTKTERFPIEQFWENGFAVAKSMLTSNEIESLRRAAYSTRDHQGDLLSNPELNWLVYDPRLLKIAKEVLSGSLVYFGDSNCLLGKESHGYHKDNADRSDPNAPDWKSKYTIIRMGIYLQDHSNYSGGLNARLGSHNIANSHGGKNVYLATNPGDIALWSLRTSHSGTGRKLKYLTSLELPPGIADRIPSFLFHPMEKERVGLFISYGLSDHHLERFIDYSKTRKYAINIWKNSEYSADALSKSAANGLTVRDVWSEIKEEEGLGLNELHIPIPY